DQGVLPALARLMAGGAWGTLASTIPASTPVAWNSIVTGVYPGKHGVFGFVRRRPGSYELDVVTSADRRRPALWTLVGEAGIPSVVVDVPFTYPPEPIHGVMVAGLGTPDVTSPFVHPPGLREALLREFSPFPLDVYFRGDLTAFLDDAVALVEHRVRLARFLLREFPWGFGMLGLMVTDRLQHVVWHHLDPGHPRHDPVEAARVAPRVRDVYRRLDDGLGRLVADLPAETAVLVASDHGFGPMVRSLSLLRWLGQSGLVALGGPRWAFEPPAILPRFRRRGSGRTVVLADGPPWRRRVRGLRFEVDRPDGFAGAVFRIPGLDPHRRYEVRASVAEGTRQALLEFDDLGRRAHPIIGGGPVLETPGRISAVFQPERSALELFVGMTTYGGNPPGAITLSALHLTEREDWSRTLAYVLDTGDATEGRRIRLNVRGREPHGVVEPGVDYEGVRARIADGVRDLRDETGRPLVRSVYRREEIYQGPYTEEGPDLVVVFEDGVGGSGPTPELAGYSFDGPISAPVSRGNSGNHRPDGIFIACGPGVVAGGRVAARIVDVCPTVLALLGVAPPADTDGRPLTEILAVGPPTPPRAVTSAASVSDPARGEAAYSEVERRTVEERLRRLGYLE
ncbi:MAG: alkaline phosphatase family protein, partial [Candidatus Rokubacteria bacterium]|nr:alkaline phosphatase family protein [Candidatus Rokubacteria bacterium]